MNKVFIFIALIIFCSVIYAQTEDWVWAKQTGGTGSDYGKAIASDASGNNYVTGYFAGTATFGSTSLTSSGGYDIFITKLDTNGNYLWAKQAGGISSDCAQGISTDSSGNSYATGYFYGTATFGTTTLTSSGNSDIFIAKLDTNGNYLWANKAGGISSDCAQGISTDSSGNNYVMGYFAGTATFGTTTLTSSGSNDIFIAKLDTNGNYLWAKKAGGTSDDMGNGICTDSSGNSYVTGYFYGTTTFGSTSLSSSGSEDIFIAKLDTNGNYLWAKKAGGTSSDYGYGISTDSSGNSYVTGYFAGTATFGSASLTSSGSADIFIAKLDTNGNYLWAKKAGGTYDDIGFGISTDSSGNSYVTGSFNVTATFGSTTLISSGSADIFIAKLDTNGNYLWVTKAGGTSSDYGYGISTDSSGNSYVTGNFRGTATFGSTSLSSSGSADIFITKIGTPVYNVIAPNGGEMWQSTTTMTVFW
ncbi:MAG: SBBP repeat-containing protein, partial [Candidatus Cloacimonetes bacterium]|nr:SBBP repeat-containing protein [Candidatus Cloacimonadota bacterium]